MNNSIYKVIATYFLFTFLIILSSCSNDVPEQYQVKNQETGEVTDYLLNIATTDEIGLDVITEWQKSIPNSDGFYYYVYADPDSYDLLICIPEKKDTVAVLVNENISINVVDSVLKVYIETTNTDSNVVNSNDKSLIHFVAPSDDVWPSQVEVYWNNVQISCSGSDAKT